MVSVCMAVFNGEKYIREQLLSILSQIKPDDEIIISDDGSWDNTVRMIKEMNDSRIKVYHNNYKRGIIGNFVNTLIHSSGEYIFLADQDDVWLPDKYSIVIEYLNNFDLVHHDSIVTNENLETVYDSLYSILNNGRGIIKNIKKSTYYGSHMAFKRKVLEKAIPFPETKEVGHDLWLGLVAEMTATVRFIPNKLILYRRHEKAYCNLFQKSSRGFLVKICGRLQIIYYLIKFKWSSN